MTKTLRFVFSDQLSESLSALQDIHLQEDVVMLCETRSEATYVQHHPKKLAFLWSAMRHFSQQLQEQGIRVRYVTLTDPANTGDLFQEIERAVEDLNPQRLVMTMPSEWRLLDQTQTLGHKLSIPVEIQEDDRFLCSIPQFKQWAKGKKQLRMEFFYREMRQRYNILMDDQGQPLGGEWNYDRENRKPPKEGMSSPKRLSHKKDQITKDVLALVRDQFSRHFGNLDPFYYALTREQALLEAHHFIERLLPSFGDYQDAMVAGEAYLYHSLLSTYLNAGLLLPLELCRMAEQAYHKGAAPLNAVEGYIRQILGWREYVRGIYWLYMPDYASMNFFEANRSLPDFYWGKKTRMFCIAEAVRHTQEHAYSHHIQRLMVTGNFALLAGISPQEVCQWYLEVYSDAYDWVELPNTLGMALFGDGGRMGSKPYAASGKYIHRMSNFCERCPYDPLKTVGPNACPFNALYWDFLDRNGDKLRYNRRLTYTYTTWDKMPQEKKEAIRRHAQSIFNSLDKNEL